MLAGEQAREGDSMKLNINARELLALHNVLHERFGGPKLPSKDDPEAILVQLHDRVKACILGALTGKDNAPFSTWYDDQQRKVEDLKVQNEKLVPKVLLGDLGELDIQAGEFDYPRSSRKKKK